MELRKEKGGLYKTKIPPGERIDSKDIFKKYLKKKKKNPNLFFGLKGRKKYLFQ